MKARVVEDIFDLQALFLNMDEQMVLAECLKLHERTHLEMDEALMKSRNIFVEFRIQKAAEEIKKLPDKGNDQQWHVGIDKNKGFY